ncbi:MAG: hypothetical protein GXY19_19545 [Phycisphaerae bacterium]|nr:hypothetical protein [Phycisphaerae bacterium]
MNGITTQIKVGTLGELLVQLRLLQFDVQAAPPLKDSGNDLIAVRHGVFRAIQVKTTTGSSYQTNGLPDHYHLLAVVNLVKDSDVIFLDESRVFLIPRERVMSAPRRCDQLNEYSLNTAHVDGLFSDQRLCPLPDVPSRMSAPTSSTRSSSL